MVTEGVLLAPVREQEVHVDRVRLGSRAPFQAVALGADLLVVVAVVAAVQVDRLAELAVALLWLAMLFCCGAYARPKLGQGWGEFHRVLAAAAGVLGTLTVVSAAQGQEVDRTVVLALVPGLLVGALSARLLARRWVQSLQRSHPVAARTLVVGEAPLIETATAELMHKPQLGLRVVGTLTPDQVLGVESGDGPPLEDGRSALDLRVRVAGADAVLFVLGGRLDGVAVRRASWQLEGTGTRLFVLPDLPEVMAHRVTVRQGSSGLLLEVDAASYAGFRRLVKAGVERVAALISLILLAPLLAVVALLVRLDSPGPALFRQVRVGKEGRTFTCLKFRTMVAGAETVLAELEAANEHDGLMFKMRRDPRITRVGATLRRYSVDELPQLVNVVLGQMSLIGPRPPLVREVEGYDAVERRRLNVRPGMTGLWQVSGRSNLPWQETVKLDLRYVENWSLTLDAVILWKTVRAVLTGEGAY